MAATSAKPFSIRPLTAGERALGAEMFGPGLDGRRVRILAVPAWNRAFVAGPALIVWPAATCPADFAAPETPLRRQAVFVHELTPVWQAQNGISLIRAKLRAGDGPRAYAYDLDGPPFAALNIEQQAMIVEHAFLASRRGETPHPAARYAEASTAWRRT